MQTVQMKQIETYKYHSEMVLYSMLNTLMVDIQFQMQEYKQAFP